MVDALAEKPRAMSPEASTATLGKNVCVPLAMSSPPTLPWSAIASEVSVVVSIRHQCTVVCPEFGPVGGKVGAAKYRLLLRQTPFDDTRRSFVAIKWESPS